MKSFVPNAAMVHTRSFGPISGSDESTIRGGNKISDPIVLVDNEVVKISAIILQPSLCEVPPLVTPENQSRESMNHSPEHLGSLKSLKQCTEKPGDLSVLYICELSEIKGKFDPERAKAFGLKPGPKYRELQNGNSVKSDMQNIMVSPKVEAFHLPEARLS